MTELSPAAQAVFDAVRVVPILLNDHMERVGIAAALRAAAVYCKRDKLILLSIADELDGW